MNLTRRRTRRGILDEIQIRHWTPPPPPPPANERARTLLQIIVDVTGVSMLMAIILGLTYLAMAPAMRVLPELVRGWLGYLST